MVLSRNKVAVGEPVAEKRKERERRRKLSQKRVDSLRVE